MFFAPAKVEFLIKNERRRHAQLTIKQNTKELL
jgi:hypothetical protein